MSTNSSTAANVTTKMFVLAVDGVDPAQVAVSLIKDVINAIVGAFTNLIEANEEYANLPSPVQFGSNAYIFYQNGSTGQLMYSWWNGSVWTQNVSVPTVTNMTAAPGSVVFEDTLYVFYPVESGGSEILYYTTSTDGVSWSAGQLVPNVGLQDSPSAAVLNDKLYVFYHNLSGTLEYVSSSDASSWSSPSSFSDLGLSNSPSAVFYDGALYVLHQGKSDNSELWYVKSIDGENWTSDTKVPNVGLVGSPSAVVYDGQIYVFHSGSVNEAGQIWVTSYNGQSWEQDIQIAPLCLSNSPSTAVFTPAGGTPMLWYMNQGPGSEGILWCNVFDGTDWVSTNPVEQSTIMSGSPGTVMFGDTLYCFFQGAVNNGKLMYITSADGKTWTSPQQVPNTGLSESPCPVVFKDTLYVFYQGAGNSDNLWYISSTDGVHWSADKQISNVGVFHYPSAVVFNDTLYVFHCGTEPAGNGQLWYTTTTDGVNWNKDQNPQANNEPIAMSSAPSAVVFDGKIYVFRQGPNNNGALLCATFDGNTWATKLCDAGIMSNSPSATVLDGTLYCFYQGSSGEEFGGGNGLLGYVTYNGSSWGSSPPNPAAQASYPTGMVLSLTQDEWDAVNAAGGFVPSVL